MDPILLPVVQSAGVVALAVVAFSLVFSWPVLRAPLDRLRGEWARLLGYAGLGIMLVFAATTVYLVPGLLLRDTIGLALVFPLTAVWLIATAALVVTGLVQAGAERAVAYAVAVVAVVGMTTGVVSALGAQRGLADRITPTGAFLLGLGAIVAIVIWAGQEEPEDSTRHCPIGSRTAP